MFLVTALTNKRRQLLKDDETLTSKAVYGCETDWPRAQGSASRIHVMQEAVLPAQHNKGEPYRS